MIHSEPYKPNEEKCCERCVFGTGVHASWCLNGFVIRDLTTPCDTAAQLKRSNEIQDLLNAGTPDCIWS